MKLASVKTQQEYTKFWGGLDQTSSAIAIPPGAAITANNYEPGVIRDAEEFSQRPIAAIDL